MSGGNILRMSDAETIQFLEYYRNEPALWDPTNDGYKKRDMRAAAAQRIVEALNLSDFTPSHVITKFKNLRSSYAQELKKIAASIKSGTSTDNVYVPKVVWFKTMDSFLRPHVKSRDTQSNLSRVSQESTEINIDEEDADNSRNETELEDMGADRSPQPRPSNEQQISCTQQTKHFTELQPAKSTRAVSEVKSNSSSVRNNNNTETPTSKRASTTRERIIKKKRLVENERPDMLMTAMDKLVKISERAAATKDDSFDYFGKYIASLLRTLPTEQALKLQQEMITLALNAHMANSMSPPSTRGVATLSDVFSDESDADTSISDLSALS